MNWYRKSKFMGIPDDVSLNINYEVGGETAICPCPKCGNQYATIKEDKRGRQAGKCSCGHKWKI